MARGEIVRYAKILGAKEEQGARGEVCVPERETGHEYRERVGSAPTCMARKTRDIARKTT